MFETVRRESRVIDFTFHCVPTPSPLSGHAAKTQPWLQASFALPVGRWAPQKPRWWVMSVQPAELSLLKVACWRSRGSHITGDVNQSISGFLFLPRSPFVSPPMFSVKAEIRKVCLGALCIRGAASHFRLDHGWQVKENKNCLYRRDADQNSSFLLAG